MLFEELCLGAFCIQYNNNYYDKMINVHNYIPTYAFK